MNKPIVSIIAAIGKNRELGKDNKLLWHIAEDMRRFKKLTSGHVIIMGRKTYESIGKPLPNRTNIIITRDKKFEAPGCVVTHSIKEALNRAKEIEKDEIFIIGGGQIYKQAISFTDKLYLTIVQNTFTADTFFPEYHEFKTVDQRFTMKDNNISYEFLDLVR